MGILKNIVAGAIIAPALFLGQQAYTQSRFADFEKESAARFEEFKAQSDSGFEEFRNRNTLNLEDEVASTSSVQGRGAGRSSGKDSKYGVEPDNKSSGDVQKRYNSLKREVDSLFGELQESNNVARMLASYIKGGAFIHMGGDRSAEFDRSKSRMDILFSDRADAIPAYILLSNLDAVVGGRNIKGTGNLDAQGSFVNYEVSGMKKGNSYELQLTFNRDPNQSFKVSFDQNTLYQLNELSVKSENLKKLDYVARRR